MATFKVPPCNSKGITFSFLINSVGNILINSGFI